MSLRHPLNSIHLAPSTLALLAIAALSHLATPAAAVDQQTQPAPAETSSAPFKPLASTTIGIEGKVLYRVEPGGPRLIARPLDRFADVNVRIADAAEDGPATLYDLRFIAQRAGRFDLRDALERVDGGPISLLPAAPVAVAAKLDPEHDGELIAMQDLTAAPRAGYRTTMIAVASAWLLVPITYFAWRITHRQRRVLMAPPPPPPTLADQLAPLVEAARTGRLDTSGRAALERLLLAYWRKRLNLDRLSSRAALDAIKADATAGSLLNALERWLHAPPLPPANNDSAAQAMRLLDHYRNAGAIQLQEDDGPTSNPPRPAPSSIAPAEVGA